MAARGSWDIELSGIGLMLDEVASVDQAGRSGRMRMPRSVSGAIGSGNEADTLASLDVPVDYSSVLQYGMGFGWRNGPATGYSHAVDGWCLDPRFWCPAGELTEITTDATSPIVASAEYNGDLFLLAGSKVLQLVDGLPPAVAVQDFGGSYSAEGIAGFRGNLYVGGQSSGIAANIWKYNGSTWTASSGPSTVARWRLATTFMEIRGVPQETLWGTTGGSTIDYVSDDPMDLADWQSAANPGGGRQVGDPQYSISKLVAFPFHLYALKQDGVYDLDNRRAAPLTPYWKDAVYQFNGIAGAVYGGRILASHQRGMDYIDVASGGRQDAPTWTFPGMDLPAGSPVFGQAQAIITDSGRFIAALWDGTHSWIVHGQDRREARVEGPGPVLWQGAMRKIANEKVTEMRLVAPFGAPRLWIGTVDSTGGSPAVHLYWLSMPRAMDPLQDLIAPSGPTMRWTATSSLYLPNEDMGIPHARKSFRRYEMTHQNLNAQAYLEAFVSVEGEDFVRQGLVNSGKYTIFGAKSDQRSGRWFQARIDATGLPQQPPILRSFVPSLSLHVRQATTLRYTVRFGDDVMDRLGHRDGRDGRRIWREIQQIMEAGTAVELHEAGEDRTVEVEQASNFVRRRIPKEPNRIESVAEITVTILSRGARYGSAVYGNDQYGEG